MKERKNDSIEEDIVTRGGTTKHQGGEEYSADPTAARSSSSHSFALSSTPSMAAAATAHGTRGTFLYPTMNAAGLPSSFGPISSVSRTSMITPSAHYQYRVAAADRDLRRPLLDDQRHSISVSSAMMMRIRQRRYLLESSLNSLSRQQQQERDLELCRVLSNGSRTSASSLPFSDSHHDPEAEHRQLLSLRADYQEQQHHLSTPFPAEEIIMKKRMLDEEEIEVRTTRNSKKHKQNHGSCSEKKEDLVVVPPGTVSTRSSPIRSSAGKNQDKEKAHHAGGCAEKGNYEKRSHSPQPNNTPSSTSTTFQPNSRQQEHHHQPRQDDYHQRHHYNVAHYSSHLANQERVLLDRMRAAEQQRTMMTLAGAPAGPVQLPDGAGGGLIYSPFHHHSLRPGAASDVMLSAVAAAQQEELQRRRSMFLLHHQALLQEEEASLLLYSRPPPPAASLLRHHHQALGSFSNSSGPTSRNGVLESAPLSTHFGGFHHHVAASNRGANSSLLPRHSPSDEDGSGIRGRTPHSDEQGKRTRTPELALASSHRFTANNGSDAIRRADLLVQDCPNDQDSHLLPSKNKSTGRCRPLAIVADEKNLSQYQVMIRKQIEVFEASVEEASTNAQGRNRPILPGQVGIRCIHCARLAPKQRKTGAVYYPNKLDGVYQTAQKMTVGHFFNHCQLIPKDVREQLTELKEQSKPSDGGGKRYWGEAIQSFGVRETPLGGLVWSH